MCQFSLVNLKMSLVFQKIFALCALFRITSSSITVEKVSEGKCILPEPPQIEFEFEWMMELLTKVRYMPMGSQYQYYLMHTMLQGTPPDSFAQWDKMCLNIEAGLSLIANGYGGKSSTLICDIETLSHVSCFPPNNPKNRTMLYLTWALKPKYAIFTTCSSDNLKGWGLMSSDKTVNEETKGKVLEHVKSLGFDTERAVCLNYNGCPD